jgi:hypothetical protein
VGDGRHRTRAAATLLVLLLAPAASHAQGLAPHPPGPYVIDIRGVSLSAPRTFNFYPALPPGTVIPARGFGLASGAQVYPFSLGSHKVGVGALVLLSRGLASTPATASTTTPDETTPDETTVAAAPDVIVTSRVVLPELSLNFGTARGWSYIAFGAGPLHIRTEAVGEGELTTSRLTVSAAGGARWFVTDHLGVGFELRLLTLARRTLLAASVGFSLK